MPLSGQNSASVNFFSLFQIGTWLFLCIGLFVSPNAAFGQDPCPDLPEGFPFLHGVASGDATSEAVVLWTRISPPGPMLFAHVKWQIGTDEALTEISAQGSVRTDTSKDFTVKVDVSDLAADTWYYYRFEALGFSSITGRTKTLPAGDADSFSAAVFSCSNYERGYFNAYRHAAEANDVQAVFHLGDYFYEVVGGAWLPDRKHLPDHVLYTLEDYRTRHAQTSSDADVMALKRQYPWYAIWDDHEFADDCWTTWAPSHLNEFGTWETRRDAARRAYFEWMPVRDNPERINYKSFDIGSLGRMAFVDDRIQERSANVGPDSPLLDDTTRTILGHEQMQWLQERLVNATQTWKLVPGSLMKIPVLNANGQPLDVDLWEGYRGDRNRLFGFLAQNGIENFVSLAGDFHSSWAGNLPFGTYDETAQIGSVGCELTTCATTSYPHTVGVVDNFIALNPHVKYIEQTRNGYMVFRLEPEILSAQWRYVSTIETTDFYMEDGQKVVITAGVPFVSPVSGNITLPVNTAALADDFGSQIWPGNTESGPVHGMLFPNAADRECQFQWYGGCADESWLIFDLSGRILASGKHVPIARGLQILTIDTASMADGIYVLRVGAGRNTSFKRLVIQHR